MNRNRPFVIPPVGKLVEGVGWLGRAAGWVSGWVRWENGRWRKVELAFGERSRSRRGSGVDPEMPLWRNAESVSLQSRALLSTVRLQELQVSMEIEQVRHFTTRPYTHRKSRVIGRVASHLVIR